jgi:hypothetical protein
MQVYLHSMKGGSTLVCAFLGTAIQSRQAQCYPIDLYDLLHNCDLVFQSLGDSVVFFPPPTTVNVSLGEVRILQFYFSRVNLASTYAVTVSNDVGTFMATLDTFGPGDDSQLINFNTGIIVLAANGPHTVTAGKMQGACKPSVYSRNTLASAPGPHFGFGRAWCGTSRGQ